MLSGAGSKLLKIVRDILQQFVVFGGIRPVVVPLRIAPVFGSIYGF